MSFLSPSIGRRSRRIIDINGGSTVFWNAS